ncbi:putative F-box/LRR-repeat protein 23 [Lolium perenne]|uniref:putative F-box/LRR-repeat protein 23 n=1 Tax=Lolium perenne TaxID=4522 RepID=UPI0021EA86D0|nr:putative F-box/LRR-repeat protein 23 [Lolium perenne]
MDAAPPPVQKEPPAPRRSRDWSLLPLDALASVFVRLGAVDVLMAACLVCRSWLDAASVPDVWRVVDMESHEAVLTKDKAVLRAMAKAAVDRSDGQLRVFAGNEFVTDDLLKYIVKSSPSLATLRIISNCEDYTKQLVSVIKEAPLLELRCLELGDINPTVGEMLDLLRSCPLLQVFRVRGYHFDIWVTDERVPRTKFAGTEVMTGKWGDTQWRHVAMVEV